MDTREYVNDLCITAGKKTDSIRMKCFVCAVQLTAPHIRESYRIRKLNDTPSFKRSSSLFPDAYLDRGFPLKSAISKALQNLMLSGISGMSAREKKKEGGGDENQRHGHRTQEVWVTFTKWIILSFLQWQPDGQEWTRKSKRKSRNRVEG